MTFLEILVQLAAIFGSLSAAIVSVLTLRRIGVVHLEINSRLTEMLALTAKAAHGEGREEARRERAK